MYTRIQGLRSVRRTAVMAALFSATVIQHSKLAIESIMHWLLRYTKSHALLTEKIIIILVRNICNICIYSDRNRIFIIITFTQFLRNYKVIDIKLIQVVKNCYDDSTKLHFIVQYNLICIYTFSFIYIQRHGVKYNSIYCTWKLKFQKKVHEHFYQYIYNHRLFQNYISKCILIIN